MIHMHVKAQASPPSNLVSAACFYLTHPAGLLCSDFDDLVRDWVTAVQPRLSGKTSYLLSQLRNPEASEFWQKTIWKEDDVYTVRHMTLSLYTYVPSCPTLIEQIIMDLLFAGASTLPVSGSC